MKSTEARRLVVTLMSAVFGPLVEAECRRALARGWLILVRTLAALAILSVTMIVLWYAWICVYATPEYQPFYELRYGLTIVEGILLTIALVIAPAILAGTLAGEKERGALGCSSPPGWPLAKSCSGGS